jgi:hypothetical protein
MSAASLMVLTGSFNEIISFAFLVAAVVEDWRSAVTAVVFLSMCVPAYALAARTRRSPSGQIAAGRG